MPFADALVFCKVCHAWIRHFGTEHSNNNWLVVLGAGTRHMYLVYILWCVGFAGYNAVELHKLHVTYHSPFF